MRIYAFKKNHNYASTSEHKVVSRLPNDNCTSNTSSKCNNCTPGTSSKCNCSLMPDTRESVSMDEYLIHLAHSLRPGTAFALLDTFCCGNFCKKNDAAFDDFMVELMDKIVEDYEETYSEPPSEADLLRIVSCIVYPKLIQVAVEHFCIDKECDEDCETCLRL